MPDVQDYFWGVLKAGQEEKDMQEGHHPPQHPQADEKDAESSPLLDSQAAKGEGACFVCCVRWTQKLCKDKLKMPSIKMATKPLLNQRMREQRLEFARAYGGWTLEQWKAVMLSDESHFELQLGERSGRCRRPVGSDRFDPKFTKMSVKHPRKVMVWGCFSWKAMGVLSFADRVR